VTSEQQREGFVSRKARHHQLADFFAGTWAGVAKRYTKWLSERVQRPSFFPGETAGDRMVPAQSLALEGRFDEGGASLLPNTRRQFPFCIFYFEHSESRRRKPDVFCATCFVLAFRAQAHTQQ